ncbi:8189_t:CDS:10 [Ambispora leptoticha]|uniref:2,4-dienoyl-CoA reductase [(3E)-enoyl-CoA-producing] n=1 Tax=Ambispora leptoticha TaxID=144679 RepID=A0A9N8WII3_9GLOM|nr:8189_t:CDS:10 [Ambispora leptoticha]
MTTTDIFKTDILKGKVAFVTGGGSGICRGMTEALLTHGASAVITSRSLERLEKAAEEMRKATGGEVLAVAADVRKPDEVEKAVKKAIEKFGKIDILINGAAGNFLAPAELLSYNAFRTVVEIDLLGTFNVSKACFPYLKKSKGSIINVSTTLHYTATLFQVHVSAAKAGIDSMTRLFAVEWGPHGIRVNCLAPGPIADTEGFSRLLPPGGSNEYLQAIPLQRFGKIKDIEHATVFLASEAASYMTGHIMVVDGGECLKKVALLPYPASVLNPKEIMDKLRAKL